MLAPSVLSRDERAAIEVAVLTAGDGYERLGTLFGRLVDERSNFTFVREVILTMKYIAGEPRAFGALLLLAKVCEEKATSFPSFPKDTLAGGREEHIAIGTANMIRIYGRTYEEFVRRFAELDAEYWSTLVGDAYGRVLGRPALDLRMRELAIVGALCTFGREPQLTTHIHGSLNCGANLAEVAETIAVAEGHGYDVSLARKVWAKIAAKHSSRS